MRNTKPIWLALICLQLFAGVAGGQPVPAAGEVLWAVEAEWLDTQRVLVRFDRPLLIDESSPDAFCFVVASATRRFSGWLAVSSETTMIFNLALGEEREPSVRYSLVVERGCLQDAEGNPLGDELIVPIHVPIAVLEWNSSWRYAQPLQEPAGDWHQADYDDHDWLMGPGVLGEEADGPVVPLLLTDLASPNEGGPTTSYFRAAFNLAGTPSRLRLSYFADDGVIIYLNGVEVHRVGVPVGQGADTLASRRVGNAEVEGPIELTEGFVPGHNILAAELHQGSMNDSDVVWGAELLAVGVVIDEDWPRIRVEPSPLFLIESEVGFLQAFPIAPLPFNLQWRRRGLPIPEATNRVFTVSQECDSVVDFDVVLSTTIGVAISEPVLVYTQSDVVPPELLRAKLSLDGSQISLLFSEGVDRGSAVEPSHYQVESVLARQRETVGSVALENGTNVVLTFEPLLDTMDSYRVIVRDVTDSSCARTPISPNPTQIQTEVRAQLVALDALTEWRYDASGQAPAPDWVDPDLDDSQWPLGPALLGVENAPLSEPIRTFLSLGEPQIGTYYFRRGFMFAGDTDSTVLQLRAVVDDGAVFYLNGVEVLRLGMAEGPVGHGDVANRVIGNASPEGPFELPAGALRSGRNVLAAEVHQANLFSSDVIFGAWLEGFTHVVGEGLGALRVSVDKSGNVELQWTAGMEWVLVESVAVHGPYEPVPGGGVSPVRLGQQLGTRYYRLRRVD